MKIACHYAIPEPPVPELDAAVQDGLRLLERFDGEINFLYPGARERRSIPRFLCGMHQLNYLRKLDRRVDVHQIFSNGLYPYPILHWLKKPIVYTSVIEVDENISFLSRRCLNKVKRFVVVTEKERKRVQKSGGICDIIVPGIELSRFSFTPCPVNDHFVLLAGSAPWNAEQFYSKGVEILLQATAELPWLKLVFLWRGKLLAEMKKRVEAYQLHDRVEILNEHVDVNKVLGRVHAATVLAGDSKLVKGFPHSLLEALAAGKPVLVSDCLAIAEYVNRNQCGDTVPSLYKEELIKRIVHLKKSYQQRCEALAKLDLRRFSSESMKKSYAQIYAQLRPSPFKKTMR